VLGLVCEKMVDRLVVVRQKTMTVAGGRRLVTVPVCDRLEAPRRSPESGEEQDKQDDEDSTDEK
jgi:hypothetical protein